MTHKILFFSYWYPNAIKTNQAYFVKQHAHALSTVCDVEVLAVHILAGNKLYEERYEVDKDDMGITTHRLYIQSKYWKWFYVALPWQYIKIKRLIRQSILPNFKFSTIHSNVIYPCGIVAYWLSSAFNCRHVITEHWSKLPKFFSRSIYQVSGKNAFQKADAITAVSQQLINVMQQFQHNRNMAVVPNVIDGSRFYPEANISKHPILTFTAVAHWQAPKNPFYFLDALAQIQAENKTIPFQVVLIGEGEILTQIARKGYTFPIKTPGNLSPEQLRQHLNACHVFLHGSDYETFSVVIIEALMCGIPCVVSPVGVAPEVINSHNGYIAKNTVPDWKEKLLLVMLNSYVAQDIARAVGNSYGLKEVGEKFAQVYRSAKLIHD